MNRLPADQDKVEDAWKTVVWLLAMIAAACVTAFTTISWLDSRAEPTITIMIPENQEIAVDVRGAVSTPGVVVIAPGDRMIDVINAAGGFTPNADQPLVNLSTRVVDGQIIVIPTQVPEVAETGTTLSQQKININTASVEELKELPGIGDVLAQRIVAYREFQGPFQQIDDLINVEGVSPTLVENLRDLVTVSGDD